jgi:hypothetical protein
MVGQDDGVADGNAVGRLVGQSDGRADGTEVG